MSINVLLLGPTGAGKSAVFNVICKSLGGVATGVESAGSLSHTHSMDSAVIADIRVIDSPGLLDSGGLQADRENIRMIVTRARDLRNISAFLLVMNFQSPRCDEGILSAIKLYVDSFGSGMLSKLGFVFTRAPKPNTALLAERVATNTTLINERCTSSCVFPFWYVDCHLEELMNLGVPQSIVEEMRVQQVQQVDGLLRWMRVSTPFSTIYAVFGEYEQVRLAREAEERRLYAASVINRVTEDRVVVVSTQYTPVMKKVERKRKVEHIALGFIKYSHHWDRWTEEVLDHYRTENTMSHEKREIITYGSGQMSHGEWSRYGATWVA